MIEKIESYDPKRGPISWLSEVLSDELAMYHKAEVERCSLKTCFRKMKTQSKNRKHHTPNERSQRKNTQ